MQSLLTLTQHFDILQPKISLGFLLPQRSPSSRCPLSALSWPLLLYRPCWERSRSLGFAWHVGSPTDVGVLGWQPPAPQLRRGEAGPLLQVRQPRFAPLSAHPPEAQEGSCAPGAPGHPPGDLLKAAKLCPAILSSSTRDKGRQGSRLGAQLAAGEDRRGGQGFQRAEPSQTGLGCSAGTGAGVTGAGVTGAGVYGAGVTGAGVTGAGVTGAGGAGSVPAGSRPRPASPPAPLRPASPRLAAAAGCGSSVSGSRLGPGRAVLGGGRRVPWASCAASPSPEERRRSVSVAARRCPAPPPAVPPRRGVCS